MTLLIIGVALWAAIHFMTTLGRGPRAAAIARIGEGPWKGLFSLVVLLSLALMIWGWRSADPAYLWTPGSWTRHLAMALMAPAVILFLCGRMPNNLRRVIRHPQLTGVKIWAAAHLIANGDTASMVLFGGLLAWAVAEVVLINARDGAWVKPEPVEGPAAYLPIIVGLVLYGALVFAHPWFAGVSPIGA